MHKLLLRLFGDNHFGVLLVTHDVAEAVTLAGRVLLLEDGRIGAEVIIDLPRPRRAAPESAAYEEQLLTLLGVDH